ncbi:peptidase U32 family protein [Fundicoccus ignavus]|uniref:U32 family peptidase n=1 Tax=Fundicoccus ignavus TaxID=2664442 RepID=A0A844C6X0_9LACT|nr:peptidase U32 family protein [Fundicoccus ignavus]MRJ46413.1 U32 family peptidase [Fundicoccus ignavus]
MIELIATAESLTQGIELLKSGVDRVVVGEEVFGLRVPGYLSFEEILELTNLAHRLEKKIIVAANAILHNDKIDKARPFLRKLKEIGVDQLLVGDTGLIQIMKETEYYIPYIYDASVLVTSHGQINFWKNYGAIEAMVAREVPYVELEKLAPEVQIPIIVQVYGAQCIHQSKRNLLDNYFRYIEKEPIDFSKRHLFLSEPTKKQTHYSIYQDSHGTHVFANNDINLIKHLDMLFNIKANIWYLDGIYTPGNNYVEIVKQYLNARELLENYEWSEHKVEHLSNRINELHPVNRELATNFFLYSAEKVK